MICHSCKTEINFKLFVTVAYKENRMADDSEEKKDRLDDKEFCDLLCLRDWVNGFVPQVNNDRGS